MKFILPEIEKQLQRLFPHFMLIVARVVMPISFHPRPRWVRVLRWIAIRGYYFFTICGMITLFYFLFLLYSYMHYNYSFLSSLQSSETSHKLGLFFNQPSIQLFGLIMIFSPAAILLLVLLRHAAKQDLEAEEKAVERRKIVQEQQVAGIRLYHQLQRHIGAINWIAWSPDGSKLVTGSDDCTIGIWSVTEKKPLHVLIKHTRLVTCVAWSPDGNMLASASEDGTVQLWDMAAKIQPQTEIWSDDLVEGDRAFANHVAWSPDGRLLAACFYDIIKIWDVETEKNVHTFSKHSGQVTYVAWSPDSNMLASASFDKTVRLWDVRSGKLLYTLTEHSDTVYAVAWSPDGHILASASEDKTMRIWDTRIGRQVCLIEGHLDGISNISFSSDGCLLASLSNDSTVRIWRSDTWEELSAFYRPILNNERSRVLAFHPNLPLLATLGERETLINIWELDTDIILNAAPANPSIGYANAKVVLLGDSGVGKSGLGLVLSKQQFVPTSSTHGRYVWTFDHQEIETDEGHKEMHEILLWDLAGQPGYRLIHQLYLNEVVVALLVFDTRSETDPFSGVYYWNRAICQAQRVQSDSPSIFKKFLVAARADRGGIGVSPDRMQEIVQELGFDGYFETSAKEGWNIEQLQDAVRAAIDWTTLPRVISTELFRNIKNFLMTEKEAGRILSTVDDLYHSFLKSTTTPAEMSDLRGQFETCIGRVEAAGMIKQLSFGKMVLLQPEILDAYASALVNAVKDEPDGLGSIAEERVRIGDFRMPDDERIVDKDQELLLLIAMIEDLLRREIALREEPFLVFPSQSTRENPDLPDPEGKAVTYEFEGPILNIYATLAVRLSHSSLFKKKDLWKNAITYTARSSGMCGIFLYNIGEGCGKLTIFFGTKEPVSEETRFYFEEFVLAHLQKRALPESVKRLPIFTCSGCGFVVTEQLLRIRTERGFHWLDCPGCGTRITLLDQEERAAIIPSGRVLEMDHAADSQRDLEAAKSTIQGKQVTRDFDVFLCYHRTDRNAVKQIGEQLKERGMLPWLDEWELRPGYEWQSLLEQQIGHIQSAAVFVGQEGVGPWQNMEIKAFLQQFIERGCPVIPVILPGCGHTPKLPLFLKNMTWVDFRTDDPDPMDMLTWGITGKRRARY